MSKLAELKKDFDSLKQRFDKAISEEGKIDFSRFSDDVIKQGLLVESNSGGCPEGIKRYFMEVDAGFLLIPYGRAPATNHGSYESSSQIRLLDNNPMPWFGGDCPIPDGVRINVWRRGYTGRMNFIFNDTASELNWSHRDDVGDIIAFLAPAPTGSY